MGWQVAVVDLVPGAHSIEVIKQSRDNEMCLPVPGRAASHLIYFHVGECSGKDRELEPLWAAREEATKQLTHEVANPCLR